MSIHTKTLCCLFHHQSALLTGTPIKRLLTSHLILSNYEKREFQHGKAVIFRQLLVCSTCFMSTLRLIDVMHHYSPCVVLE